MPVLGDKDPAATESTSRLRILPELGNDFATREISTIHPADGLVDDLGAEIVGVELSKLVQLPHVPGGSAGHIGHGNGSRLLQPCQGRGKGRGEVISEAAKWKATLAKFAAKFAMLEASLEIRHRKRV